MALEKIVVNRKRIRHLMNILRIKVIYPGINLSKRNQEHKVYPYLLKGLTIEKRCQAPVVRILVSDTQGVAPAGMRASACLYS